MYTQIVYARVRRILAILNHYVSGRLATKPNEVLIDDGNESVGPGINADQEITPISLDACTRKEDFNVSSPSSYSLAGAQPRTFNTQAYLLAKQRMHEIEGQKAMLILLSRHERWKAGGPL